MAFPMEMSEFPGRTWIVSHKRVAVAAQLGKMGLHRSVIHPRLGSFVLLGTVLTAAEAESAPAPLTFDPCISCKLCVAACPVGAIEPDGAFRFSACYDHNYREFMTGFAIIRGASSSTSGCRRACAQSRHATPAADSGMPCRHPESGFAPARYCRPCRGVAMTVRTYACAPHEDR